MLVAGEPDPGNPSSIPESSVQGWGRDWFVKWVGYAVDMPALVRTVDVVVLRSYGERLPKMLAQVTRCTLPLIMTAVRRAGCHVRP